MKKIAYAIALAGITASSFAALNAAAQAKAATPTIGDVLAASGIDISGYVDASYSHLSGSGVFTSGVPNRVFDYEPSSFNLHQAAITIARQPKEGFGGVVNLTLGKDAKVIKAYDQGTTDFDLTQAYAQYARGPLTVVAGKYVTLSGAEVIASTGNPNYSRSILFGYAIPFTHTGMRATYAATDTISIILGVCNGWDQVKDANKQKTVEAAVAFTPNKMFSFLLQGYTGTEPVTAPFPGPLGGKRNLLDFVATVNATDKLSFVLNYDYGTQAADGFANKAKWTGVAGYVNYAFSDTWKMSVRGEYFNDKDGYRTGVVQKWKEATVTLTYSPTKSVDLRAEVRGDKSDVAAFIGSNGVTGKKSQNSAALQAIYKF
jgi:Putative beta-barrel porin-2, OmpL-like. bbp2